MFSLPLATALVLNAIGSVIEPLLSTIEDRRSHFRKEQWMDTHERATVAAGQGGSAGEAHCLHGGLSGSPRWIPCAQAGLFSMSAASRGVVHLRRDSTRNGTPSSANWANGVSGLVTAMTRQISVTVLAWA